MIADERLDRVERLEGALRTLADDWPEAALVEDLVAARLFGGERAPVKIGRFTVLEVVGSGGMGTVYAAHDPELDRTVALKMVRPSPTSDESLEVARSRLLREARVLARLTHPNVVTIHEHGIHDDQVFLVMELVEGVPLDGWLAAAPRSWAEVVEVYLAAGQGLAAAHAIGVIHRDFKPANVLVGRDGRPRVVDFGLARPVGLDSPPASRHAGEASVVPIEYSITASGLVSGTPGYMAPELLAGAKASPGTDVYAFCVAVLEALSPGVAHGQALAVSAHGVPGAVIDVLLRGINPDPEARWSAMEPLLAALRSAAGQSSRSDAPAATGRAVWLELGLLAVVLATVVGVDRLGVLAVLTPARVLALDLGALGLAGLVLARRPAWRGTFAKVLVVCLVAQLGGDAVGWLVERPLPPTVASNLLGAAALHGLGALLAERWLRWCAGAYLLAAALVLLAPGAAALGYPLGHLASLLVAAIHHQRLRAG